MSWVGRRVGSTSANSNSFPVLSNRRASGNNILKEEEKKSEFHFNSTNDAAPSLLLWKRHGSNNIREWKKSLCRDLRAPSPWRRLCLHHRQQVWTTTEGRANLPMWEESSKAKSVRASLREIYHMLSCILREIQVCASHFKYKNCVLFLVHFWFSVTWIYQPKVRKHVKIESYFPL